MATRSVKPASKRSGSKFFHTGAEGRGKVSAELERAKNRSKGGNTPFRFYVPVGEVKQGIILDAEPSFFMYEHQLKDERSGKWNKFVPCVAEHENCPACEVSGQEGTYIMFLSVLDLSEYEDKKGVVHEFSRKLLAIKPRQQSKFMRKFDREGTLRGAKFEFARDDPKSASIGDDIQFLEFVDEEELDNDYWTVYTDREGKDHEENQAEPFDYLELFPEPTLEYVEKMVGVRTENAGSRSHNRKALKDDDDDGGDGWDSDEEDAPWDDKEKSRGRTSRASRSKAKDEEEEEAPKGRTARRSRVKPDPEEEEEDDAPPARTITRRTAVDRDKPASTRQRRVARR